MKNILYPTLLGAGLMALASSIPAVGQERTPAFPGAEGFGRYTTGGRGGKVYHVTNLRDNGTGSLRWALSQAGPRTIVFDVSGTIHLEDDLNISPNTTIAGQTAPGDGICIADYPVSVGSNTIVRYVRFRLGNKNVLEGGADSWDGLSAMDSHDIIIDHCSISWSIDECCSVYGNENTTVQWSIVAHSLVNSGHSKGAHGYGGNWGGSGASFHHNLLAHHGSRTPRLGPRQTTQTDERMDMRNNVIYNFGGNGCYGGEGMNVNIVNNYYKPGPATPTDRKGQRIAGVGIRSVEYCLDKNGTAANIKSATGKTISTKSISGNGDGKTNYLTIDGTRYDIADDNTITFDGKKVEVKWNGWKPMLQVWGTYFVDGNTNTKYPTVNTDNWEYGMYRQIDTNVGATNGTWNEQVKSNMRLNAPIEYVYTTTHSAADCYEPVLAYAGASLSRDSYDQLIVADTREGKASFTGKGLSKGMINSPEDLKPDDAPDTWSPWPSLQSAEAPADTDKDGIPDAWETANGLDPNNAADANTYNDEGYTMLEVYLASIVEHITEAQNAGGTADGAIVEFDPVKDVYEISKNTRISGGNFEDGINISNTKGGSYVTKGDMMGCGPDIVHTIILPERAEIKWIHVEGCTRYSDNQRSDASLVELNGKTFEPGTYALKKGTDITSFDATIEGGAKGSMTMKWQGNNPYFKIFLHTTDPSGVENIITAPESECTDNGWYTLQGIRMDSPAGPGLYIHRGKKIIIK